MSDTNDEFKKVSKVVSEIHSHYGDYHNHKETMAHAAMAAQVAATIAIMSLDGWPSLYWNAKGVFLRIGVWLLWIGLFLYTGWEMMLRRWAATVAGASGKCMNKLSQIHSLDEYKFDDLKQAGKIYKFISFILWLPWTCGCFAPDPKTRSFPQPLLNEIENINVEKDLRLLMLEIIFFLANIGCAAALLWKGLT